MAQLKADFTAFLLWLRVVRSPRACCAWRNVHAVRSFLLGLCGQLKTICVERFSQDKLGGAYRIIAIIS